MNQASPARATWYCIASLTALEDLDELADVQVRVGQADRLDHGLHADLDRPTLERLHQVA